MSRIQPLRVALMSIALLVAVGLAAAIPSTPRETTKASTGETNLYEQGMDLVKAEKWTEARAIFEQLVVKDPRNPDAVNMLAYTQRKTGDLDDAFENYHKALAIKPKFPEAREYLAEAHLQAALREMDTLVGYGGNGEDAVAKLTDAFQEAASRVADMHGGDSKAADKKKSSNW